MKITQFEIKNFKSLHEVEFTAGSPANSLIFINGRNGNGKTSLQTALKWCFYGITPADSILAKAAALSASAGEVIDVSVEVVFEDEETGDLYSVRRSQVFIGDGKKSASASGQSTVVVKRTPISPIEPTEIIVDPDSWLELNFPERLINYFLFDGEIMFKFFDVRVKGAIERAVREIARVDMFEKVATKFRAIESSVNRNIARISGGDAGKILGEIEREQTLATHLAGEIRENQKMQEERSAELAEIARKLAGRDHLEAFVSEQNTLRGRVLELNAELKVRKAEFEAKVVSIGVNAIFTRTFEGFFDEVERARAEDRLPPPFEPEPLKMLLERERCICGCDAAPDSPAALGIKAVIDKYTESSEIGRELQVVNEGVLKIQSAIPSQKAAVDSLNVLITGLEREIGNSYNRIDEISRLIGDDNEDDIAELGRAQRVANERQRELIADRTALDGQATTLAQKIEKLKASYDKSVKGGAETSKLQKRARIAGMLADAAEAVHGQAIEIVRSKLEESMNDKFRFVKDGHYLTQITDDFDVLTLDTNGNEISISEGENMLKAYLFSISLREVIGLHFPLIVDTPAGRLDDLNRLELSKKLSEMIAGAANQVGVQVVFFMTDSEYTPYTRQNFASLEPVESYLEFNAEKFVTKLGYGIAPSWTEIEVGAWRDWAEGKIK